MGPRIEVLSKYVRFYKQFWLFCTFWLFEKVRKKSEIPYCEFAMSAEEMCLNMKFKTPIVRKLENRFMVWGRWISAKYWPQRTLHVATRYGRHYRTLPMQCYPTNMIASCDNDLINLWHRTPTWSAIHRLWFGVCIWYIHCSMLKRYMISTWLTIPMIMRNYHVSAYSHLCNYCADCAHACDGSGFVKHAIVSHIPTTPYAHSHIR